MLKNIKDWKGWFDSFMDSPYSDAILKLTDLGRNLTPKVTHEQTMQALRDALLDPSKRKGYTEAQIREVLEIYDKK